MPRPKPLFTIGYEQATPRVVFDELKRAKVKLLVDVRAVAASRKAGFSKRQLAAGLDENGIAYVHLQKLGTPAEGREAARKGDLDKLWRVYNKHLKMPEAIEQLDELTAIVKSGTPICLLCFERDAHRCHRLRIAELICERLDVKVEHLAARLD
jgi:uncharacterized protein (DUF488 family)